MRSCFENRLGILLKWSEPWFARIAAKKNTLSEKTRAEDREPDLRKSRKRSGVAGYRSPYLVYAKHTLYHLSYNPKSCSLRIFEII